ncbi:F0F1 ATP synthase subunit delta [Methylobrevis albus]|uniref:ATP synthase subunit delta n=1 Tax=Methylobrevis albus TaxID=2793297 RepID=A0A931MWX2_9HYPH|nr:F0F1 ATP synthase subunit delta [Methylobrevis albus]MBH0238058.1 F0F1 ATP synthase subunit delta [Methylobrevis albus]
MSETDSAVSGVAQRYATALFDLAIDGGATDAVEADAVRFEGLVAESADLARVVRSPVFTADDQLKAVSAVLAAAGIDGLFANVVKLAARNRRLSAVPDIIKGYRQLVAVHRGEVTADVVSAEPLADAHAAELKAALSAMTGKTVVLDASVDPSLIGGLIVRLGSRMIDTSIKSKLNALKIALKEVG